MRGKIILLETLASAVATYIASSAARPGAMFGFDIEGGVGRGAGFLSGGGSPRGTKAVAGRAEGGADFFAGAGEEDAGAGAGFFATGAAFDAGAA